MESEFDKEMDVLLRQAMRRDDAARVNTEAHLDADEINAFAEQKLSGKAQIRAIEHFADCSRCRNILSNLIAFNAHTESEIVPAKEKKLVAEITIPWYKKLFSFPQIGYAMGILTLIFGGIIAVIVLKSSSQNSSEVAQMEKGLKPQSTIPASVASNSNANYLSSNSADMSMNSNASAALTRTENKNIQMMANSSAVTEKAVEAAKPASKSAQSSNEPESAKKEKETTAAPAPPITTARENNLTNLTVDGKTADSVSAEQQIQSPQNSVSRNQSKPAPERRSVQSLPINGRDYSTLQKSERRAEPTGGAADKKDDNESVETKSVGGKNFRRSNGVWYDANYKNQKTITVRRSSDDYKKLDVNLHSIADKLGGVVVIVSGDKAYRIQ